MLERMSGPLCEAVLDLPGTGVVLAELARSNLLLVPLDRRGQWYRYHHLFRDMLLAELERLEPGLIPVLRRRAAGWCQGNRQPEEALEYSIAAGDVEAAARLMERALPTGLPASPDHDPAALVPVAGRPGRDGGTPASRHLGLVPVAGCPGGQPRPSGGPTRSIAGNTRTLPGPTTRSLRRRQPHCGARCADEGSSKCAPTPTRQRTSSRRSASWRRRFRLARGRARPLRRQGRRRCVLGGRRQNRA